MNFAIKLFNQNKSINQTLVLYLMYCFALLLLRAKITQSVYLFFLIWNLFLAIIPYIISLHLLSINSKYSNKRFFIILIAWLILIPNSFYIITDLVHLNNSTGFLFWLDLIIISSYALTGFGFGLFSLLHIEKLLSNFFSPKQTSIIIFSITTLCGFGLYIGRILRYNSWDIVSNPINLVIDLFTTITSSNSLFFSIQFGVFIYFTFLIKKSINIK